MFAEDKVIVDKFRDESTRTEAFGLLLEKYQQKIYWHIRRMVISHEDADDVMQEVFIKVWKHFAKFREDSQIYTWLYRVASNECISFLNKKKQRNTVDLADEESSEYLMNSLLADTNLDFKKVEWKLQRALLTLPDRQRQVFMMKFYDDLKYEEISEILKTSVGALKASYFHAVRKIEQFLIEDSTFD